MAWTTIPTKAHKDPGTVGYFNQIKGDLDYLYPLATIAGPLCSAFVVPFGDGSDGAGPTTTSDLTVPAAGLQFSSWTIPTGVTITLVPDVDNTGDYRIAVSGTFEMQGTASIVCTGKGAAGGRGASAVTFAAGKNGEKGSGPTAAFSYYAGGGGGGSGGVEDGGRDSGSGGHGGKYPAAGLTYDSASAANDIITNYQGAAGADRKTSAYDTGGAGSADAPAIPAPSGIPRLMIPTAGAGGGGGGSGSASNTYTSGAGGAGGAGGAALWMEMKTAVFSAACSIVNSGAAGTQGGVGSGDAYAGCGGSGGGGGGGQTAIVTDALTDGGVTLTVAGGAGGAAQTGTGVDGGAGGAGSAGWAKIVEV